MSHPSNSYPSGNVGVSIVPGRGVTYDRGELLWLIAKAIMELDACCEEMRITFALSDSEVADVLAMVD